MSEKKFIKKVIAHLRSAMPGAVVIRHEDKFTKGIPDASITAGGRTVWLEFKWVGDSAIQWFRRTGRLPIKPFPKLQLRQMIHLNSQGCARYVLGSRGKSLVLFPTDVLSAMAHTLEWPIEGFVCWHDTAHLVEEIRGLLS